jgi:Concanavalin A-like lectin/glucanases superfamily
MPRASFAPSFFGSAGSGRRVPAASPGAPLLSLRSSLSALVLAAALLAGCGNVEDPDPLIQRCAMYLTMDQEGWKGTPGEVLDECGGDDPGAARAGVTTVPNGSRGRAASFPNRSGCIDVPDSVRLRPTDALTLSAWIYPTGLTGEDEEAFGIISKRTGKDLDDSYNLSLWTGDKLWVELQDSGERFPGNTRFTNNQWTQVTMVYDGQRLPGERVRTYVNGLLDLVGAESSAMLSSAAVPLRVGCMHGVNAMMMPTNQGFIGQLDDVVIWTRSLGDAEVAEWYRRTSP